MDIRELLRHIQGTPSDRAVQRATGAHRQTVQRYRTWATQHGLLDQPLPPVDELQRLLDQTLEAPPPPQVVSSVEPYRTLVSPLRAEGTEVAAIWHRLTERQPDVTVRVERAPGEEARTAAWSAASRRICGRTC